MKALTMIQPWATLVALGAKRSETLSWSTPYRGLLAIHAAEIYPQWAKDLAAQEPFCTVLRDAGFRHWIDLPTGRVIAVCRLDDCRLIGELPDDLKAEFDPYTPRYYAWQFSDVRQLPQPFYARDGFGLWEWCVPAELTAILDTMAGAQVHSGALTPAA